MGWAGLLLLLPAPSPPSPSPPSPGASGQARALQEHSFIHGTSRLWRRRKWGVDEVMRIPGACRLCLVAQLGSPDLALPELHPPASLPRSSWEVGSPDPRVVLPGTCTFTCFKSTCTSFQLHQATNTGISPGNTSPGARRCRDARAKANQGPLLPGEANLPVPRERPLHGRANGLKATPRDG